MTAYIGEIISSWDPYEASPFIQFNTLNWRVTATDPGATDVNQSGRSIVPIMPGEKKFFSVTFPVLGSAWANGIGLANDQWDTRSELPGEEYYPGVDNTACMLYDHDVGPVLGGGQVDYGFDFEQDDIIDWAVDRTVNKAWIRVNGGPWNGTENGDPEQGVGGYPIDLLGNDGPIWPLFTVYFHVGGNAGECLGTFVRSFVYPPPNGFTAVLPEAGSASTGWSDTDKGEHVALSADGFTATFFDNFVGDISRGVLPVMPGSKKFFSITPGVSVPENVGVGISIPSFWPAITSTGYLGAGGSACAYDGMDGFGVAGVFTSTGEWFSAGDTVDFAIDYVNRLLWLRINNGQWNGSLAGDPAAGTGGIDISVLHPQPLLPTAASWVPAEATINLLGPFTYLPPAGFDLLDGTQAAPVDFDVPAYVAKIVALGGTVSAPRQALLATLVDALEDAAVWPALDRLWIHAAENTQSALVDLKVGQVATPINAPAFTVNRGYKGNGTTSYLNTNYRSGYGEFTINNGAMGTWVTTAPTTTSGAEIGHTDSFYSWIVAKNTGTNFSAYAVNLTAMPATATQVYNGGTYLGHYHIQREATTQEFYKNGVKTFENYDTTPIDYVAAMAFRVLAASNESETVINKFSDAQVAVSYAGRSLTAAQVTSLYNALRTYLTAVGVP